jgi:hypothetical protein
MADAAPGTPPGYVFVNAVRLWVCPTGAAVLVITIGPLVADAGTTAFSTVVDVCVTDPAATPLKVTFELALKPTPLIVTVVPAGPLAGENELNESVGVNAVALVAVPPPVVTVIFPAVIPLGAVTVIWVAVSVCAGATTPLNFTVAPAMFVPWIVTTVVPATPVAGEKLEIVGARVAPVTVIARRSIDAFVAPVESLTVSETTYVPAL